MGKNNNNDILQSVTDLFQINDGDFYIKFMEAFIENKLGDSYIKSMTDLAWFKEITNEYQKDAIDYKLGINFQNTCNYFNNSYNISEKNIFFGDFNFLHSLVGNKKIAYSNYLDKNLQNKIYKNLFTLANINHLNWEFSIDYDSLDKYFNTIKDFIENNKILDTNNTITLNMAFQYFTLNMELKDLTTFVQNLNIFSNKFNNILKLVLKYTFNLLSKYVDIGYCIDDKSKEKILNLKNHNIENINIKSKLYYKQYYVDIIEDILERVQFKRIFSKDVPIPKKNYMISDEKYKYNSKFYRDKLLLFSNLILIAINSLINNSNLLLMQFKNQNEIANEDSQKISLNIYFISTYLYTLNEIFTELGYINKNDFFKVNEIDISSNIRSNIEKKDKNKYPISLNIIECLNSFNIIFNNLNKVYILLDKNNEIHKFKEISKENISALKLENEKQLTEKFEYFQIPYIKYIKFIEFNKLSVKYIKESLNENNKNLVNFFLNTKKYIEYYYNESDNKYEYIHTLDKEIEFNNNAYDNMHILYICNYINSLNIIFLTGLDDEKYFKQYCEQLLEIDGVKYSQKTFNDLSRAIRNFIHLGYPDYFKLNNKQEKEKEKNIDEERYCLKYNYFLDDLGSIGNYGVNISKTLKRLNHAISL